MNDWALIARADRGGIASQSLNIATQCEPRRVLIVDLDSGGRGKSIPSLYDFVPESRVCAGYPRHEDMEWLCAGMASLFSIEGIYGEPAREVLASTGTRLVLQANPELFVPEDLRDTNLTVVAPTDWRLELLGDAEVLPVPVDSRLAPEERAPGPVRVAHMTGNAMLDRNGTLCFLRALRLLPEVGMEVLVANQMLTSRTVRDNRVKRWPEVDTYLDRWASPRPDILIQPRRYGGLCLPAQEAAACGIPTIMPDLAPQSSWPLPLFAAEAGREFPMKGGKFLVAEPDLDWLAAVLRALVEDEAVRAAWGEKALGWAESLSWERWRTRYLALLCG